MTHPQRLTNLIQPAFDPYRCLLATVIAPDRLTRRVLIPAFLVWCALGGSRAALGQSDPAPITVPAARSVAVASHPAVDTRQNRLYVVTYSHLDTEWCWTYRDSILDYIPHTLTENFTLFDKYPHYVFNWTGANRYRFIKEYYPREFQRLKQYVAAGRWIPTGSAWDENDAIVPAPESIIRSVLYSNRWFQKEFGKTSNQYMMPDTFGFPASLPTILAHCGLQGFSTKKLTYGAGAAVGIPFNVGRWIGPDGQSVIAALNPGDYRTRITEDLSNSPQWLERLQSNGKSSGIFVDYMYHGNGDLGGSPGEESAKWLEKSLAGTGPVKVIAGGADDFFRDITPDQKARLPAYKGDLLLIQHSAGSINSGAAMKRWNHRNERLADAAERAAVGADLVAGSRYPRERLTDAWLRFLGGQMHDILPGTSIPAAYEFAWNDQVVALNQFADVSGHAVSEVARHLDTRTKGIPLVVYNPLSFEREDIVTADVVFQGTAPTSIQVLGPDGKPVPAQLQQRSGNHAVVQFLARVPSVGFAVFSVRRVPSPVATSTFPLRVTTREMENMRYRVRIDTSGDVFGIYDKSAHREMLSAPLRLAFCYEKPQQHPAWNMDWEDRQKTPLGYVDGPAKVTILENGPARVALQIERSARGSRFRQIVRLAAGTAGDRVEFVTDVNWRTTESSLKAVFPLAVANQEAIYNLGVGTVARGNNNPKKYEVPAQEWFDLTDPKNRYGVSVLNEAKYGSDKPDDCTLRLTLLYTPGVRDRFQYQGTQDWGQHRILYGLQGHVDDWRTGHTADQAACLNQPLQVFQSDTHKGERGANFSLLGLTGRGVYVAALKKAEASSEIIVRLFEQNGEPVFNARLQMAAPITHVREVNGQEKPTEADGKLVLRDGAISFEMKAYRPRAFALTLKKSPVPVPARQTTQFLALPFNADAFGSSTGTGTSSDHRNIGYYPQKLLPPVLESGGIVFQRKSGPGGTSTSNALVCNGQRLRLPQSVPRKGHWLYLLSAADTDATTTLRFQGINGKSVSHPVVIQSRDGYIGQWDARVWEGEVPTQNPAVWKNALKGLQPGFIKRDPIAWYADHLRLKNGVNDPYHFCYLFRYSVYVPEGTRTVILPEDKHIWLFAATLSERPPDLSPAFPLYDRLATKPTETVLNP